MATDTFLSTNKIILFAPIEGDLVDINTRKQGYNRHYEQEAIKCFKCWRKNAGYLSQIPIYAICPTRNTVTENTKKIFKELNVTYIEAYHDETESYLNGYWNIPLVGNWVEQNLNYEISIKIDLDMYIIKELPKRFFELKNLPLVGRYDEDSAKHAANKLNFSKKYGNPFDTGFVISNRTDFLYKIFYEELKLLTSEFQGGAFEDSCRYGFKIGKGSSDYGVLEEFAMNLVNEKYPGLIKELVKYNLGEFYVGVDQYSDDEIDNIYFFHEHIPNTEPGYDGSRARLNYVKRLISNGVPHSKIRLDNCD